jgi:hypothetical protein
MCLQLSGVRALTLLLGSSLMCSAATPSRFIRRLTLVAVAAAQAMDAYSTHVAVANGAVELNPFLSRNGHPLWGRIIGVKIGITAGLAFAEELSDRKSVRTHDKLWAVTNSMIAGPTMYTAVHNFALADRLKSRGSQSRAPNY